jgi:hypothetical protein
MGLLDDAIREHLELKRLRGADPGDVAREEQDALGPVRREREAEHSEIEDGGAKPPRVAPGSFFSDPEPPATAEPSGSSQETIEINMEAELAAGMGAGETGVERVAPVTRPRHTQGGEEEALEWEMPGERSDVSSDDPGHQTEADPHVEDVLEETPDFLRDTPEQERLWFEQRPPRDFDFNE